MALTDPDSRKLKGPHGYLIGYNAQVAVDAQHDLIVAEEVVQAANDLGQLSSLATAAKAELQVEQLPKKCSNCQLGTGRQLPYRTFGSDNPRTVCLA